MFVYAVLLFVVAVVFAIVSIRIYRGETSLIHAYHQMKVADHAAYGKAFGKALSVLAASAFVSGLISLMGEAMALPAVGVLLIGLVCGIVCIVVVQRRYNGGVF